MERLPKDAILEYNDDTLHAVRKSFGLDKPGEMAKVVSILEDWVKEQHHFTKKDFERRYLETTIIVSKGSIERAKSRLDKKCTLGTLMPHISIRDDIRYHFKTDLKDINLAVLPKMTKNNERVLLLRNVGKKFEDTLMTHFNRIVVIFLEYLRRNDYAESNILVLDYQDVNLLELCRILTLSAIQDSMALLLDGCGMRIKAMYFISPSNLVGTLVALLKQVLSTKLGERIYVLKDRKELEKNIEQNILPKDYGGHEKSVEDLHEQWLDVLTSEEHTRYMKEMSSARTDETRRQSAKFNEEYLGMPGSFRKLNVD